MKWITRGILPLIVLSMIIGTGCSKRQVTKTDADQMKKEAPTITISAEPAEIEHGNCATLTWETSDAAVATLSVIGNVPLSGNKEVCPPVTTDYTLTAKGPGGITISRATVTVLPPPKPVKAEIPIFNNIHFDFDKSDIRMDARPELERIASYMRGHKDASLLIEGHCDERGTNEYNFALGERRAQSAKDYITDLGIEESRIKTISYGEERPADPGHDEGAWSKNRRAVFIVN